MCTSQEIPKQKKKQTNTPSGMLCIYVLCACIFLESCRFRRNFDITICYLQQNTLNCCNWKILRFPHYCLLGNLFFCSVPIAVDDMDWTTHNNFHTKCTLRS